MEINKRSVSPQDVSWFLDLHERGRLDLDPPYQRKSVWSPRDRRFFLNTIFTNFPTPALFIHRTMEAGRAIYHVVDGKQRLETIIKFASNGIRLGDDFGDTRLDKKRFKDLDEDMKNVFWNYQLVVEQLTSAETNYIREIFDRVNRNTRKLTRQEVRHARFDGWFASRVDSEAESDAMIWRQFGIVTPARARRMSDAQFIAEILILTISGRVMGFDQDVIDQYYSDYDDLPNVPAFDSDAFELKFAGVKNYIAALVNEDETIAENAKTATHFYSLWALLYSAEGVLPEPSDFAPPYSAFMQQVVETDIESLALEAHSEGDGEKTLPPTVLYYLNAQAAPTELPQRRARHQALRRALLDDEGVPDTENAVFEPGASEQGAPGEGG